MDLIRVRDRFPRVVVAEWDALEGAYDPLKVARVAVDGLFTLGAELFEPLGIEVGLACCDAPTGAVIDVPEDEYRHLSAAGSPESGAARPLDVEGILSWLEQQLSFECPTPDAVPGWGQLTVEHVRARLPQGVVGSGQDFVTLGYVNGKLQYPVSHIDGGQWVYGPSADHPDASPMSVSILQDAGYLSMSLSLGWTLWTDEAGGAFRSVHDALGRLSGAGWKL